VVFDSRRRLSVNNDGPIVVIAFLPPQSCFLAEI
jgi:hypothetical protein